MIWSASGPAGRSAPNRSAVVADENGWRVLLVDDSIVVRAAVRAILAELTDVATVETVRSADAAISLLGRTADDAPIDVILLDVEMPAMSGIEALPHLLRASPSSRVVMVSSLTHRGAATTMQALAAGASDYLCKPAPSQGQELDTFRTELASKLAIWGTDARRERQRSVDTKTSAASRPVEHGSVSAPPGSVTLPAGRLAAPRVARSSSQDTPAEPSRLHTVNAAVSRAKGPTSGLGAVAIGSSTGGPQALMKLFGALSRPLSCPVFITQHMPPAFTAMLAEQINRLTAGSCSEATDGEVIASGKVYMAPGDKHMLVTPAGGGQPTIQLTSTAPENYCRPAVDPMLRSLAPFYRDKLCVVILTGMGHDGCAGARLVKQQGGSVIAQDEASSVVWGMPGAVVRDGLADHVLPLAEIAALLDQKCATSCSGAA